VYARSCIYEGIGLPFLNIFFPFSLGILLFILFCIVSLFNITSYAYFGYAKMMSIALDPRLLAHAEGASKIENNKKTKNHRCSNLERQGKQNRK